MTHQDMRRAAHWLAVSAAALKAGHTIRGRFVNEPAVEAEYKECRELVGKLRQAARGHGA